MEEKINQPKVSVIIPTFNSEEFLRECIESAVNQTLKNIEIIIIDSASTDGTIEIIKEYAQNDNRIKIIYRGKEYVGISRNKALEIATGEYIVFLDSDDFLELDACEKIYNRFKNTGCDYIYFYNNNYINNNKTKDLSKLRPFEKYLNQDVVIISNMKENLFRSLEPFYKAYDRKFLIKNNIKFSVNNWGEDAFFATLVILNAKTTSFLNESLYNYRKRFNSSSLSKGKLFYKDVTDVRSKGLEQAILNGDNCLLEKYVIYMINSIFYWYDKFTGLYPEIKKDFFNEIHKTFKRIETVFFVKEVEKSINYSRFCFFSKNTYKKYKTIEFLKKICSFKISKKKFVFRFLGIAVLKISKKKNNFKFSICYIPILKFKDKDLLGRNNYKKRVFYLLAVPVFAYEIHSYKKNLEEKYERFSLKYNVTINRIKNKIKNKEKVVVAFYVNDTRFKCFSLFEKLKKSERYHPILIVGKNKVSMGHAEYQTEEDISNIVSFYKSLNYETFLAHDFEKNEPIDLKHFNIDIIFYSKQWALDPKHNIGSVINYALSCYVPYFISNSYLEIDVGYEFHNLLWKYFLLNNNLLNASKKYMPNHGKNLKVVGHPILDAYLKKEPEQQKKYVIYAPHCQISGSNFTNFSTFEWNGKFILEYAKKHPEIKWCFKPHPVLKGRLISWNVWSKEDVENYWNEWANIGLLYEAPDYFDIFKQSKCLITDCGSFLAEYMPTKMPVILPMAKNRAPFNLLSKKITKYYYKPKNLTQLEKIMDEVLLKEKDPLREKRINMLNELNMVQDSAQNIIDYFDEEFSDKI